MKRWNNKVATFYSLKLNWKLAKNGSLVLTSLISVVSQIPPLIRGNVSNFFINSSSDLKVSAIHLK